MLESDVNPAQHGLKRNPCILPCFDENPIERRQPQHSSPMALEVLFNFGEIVEVVFHGESTGRAGAIFFPAVFLFLLPRQSFGAF